MLVGADAAREGRTVGSIDNVKFERIYDEKKGTSVQHQRRWLH
jgi:hypothetical protein